MDGGRGRFVPVPQDRMVRVPERAETTDGIFAVGDIVEVRGSRFRVQTIGPKRLTLKLLRRQEPTP